MIKIKNEHIANVPCLHIVKEELEEQRLPFVLFIHGFGSAKEHNLHYAYYLAEKGFRIVLPDALLHGEREKEISEAEFNMSFWDIVVHTIHEIEEMKEEMLNKRLIDHTKIGVAGTSMGGIVTLGALTQYSWINTAASLMGSPAYVEFAKALIQQMKQSGELPISDAELEEKVESLKNYDLSLQPEKLSGRPLFFWHGMIDKVVPFKLTHEFYKSIQHHYKGNEASLKFISEEEAEHKVTRSGILETVSWFVKHLS